MADATFATPDLTTFARPNALGLRVTGQFLEPDRAVLACRVLDRDDRCRRCGEQGRPRDSTTRWLAHEPFGWRPTILLVTVRRYRCGHVWRQDTSSAAKPRARLSRGGLRWALTRLVTLSPMGRQSRGIGPPRDTAGDTANRAFGCRRLVASEGPTNWVTVC